MDLILYHKVVMTERELTALLKSLDVDEDRLLEATFDQAKLFREIAKYRKECLEARFAADSAKDDVYVGLARSIRKRYDERGDKLTEAGLTQEVKSHSKYKAARDKANEAAALDDYSKLLVECFRQRKEGLRVAVDLLAQEAQLSGFTERLEKKIASLRENLMDNRPKRRS